MRTFLLISLLAVLAVLVLRERYWRSLAPVLSAENQRLVQVANEATDRAEKAEKNMANIAKGAGTTRVVPSTAGASSTPVAPKRADVPSVRELTWQERYQSALTNPHP